MGIADMNVTRTNPIAGFTKQALLGTLLGDGSMQWNTHTNPEYGRFYITHGSKQEAYCRHKAEILKDYVRTPPAIRKNMGWGNGSCVFSTVTSPAFEFLRSLCYRSNLKTGRLMKWVTPEWAAQLDAVSLAYWYMDDGSISTSQAWITLHTQSFTKQCVRILAKRLEAFGLAPSVNARRKKDGKKQKYWAINLAAEDSRKFVELVKPYIHESMTYKTIIPCNSAVETVPCQFCGDPTPKGPRSSSTKNMIACEKPECKAAKHRIICNRHNSLHRAAVNARHRELYQRSLTERRRKSREAAAERHRDPVYRTQLNEKRRLRRAAAAALRVPILVACQFCGIQIPKGNRRNGNMIACSNPECKRKKHRIICIKSLLKLRSSPSSTLVTSVSGM